MYSRPFPILPCLLALATGFPALAWAQDASKAEGPAQVRIVEHGDGYRMTVDGQPYYVRGAGSASMKLCFQGVNRKLLI